MLDAHRIFQLDCGEENDANIFSNVQDINNNEEIGAGGPVHDYSNYKDYVEMKGWEKDREDIVLKGKEIFVKSEKLGSGYDWENIEKLSKKYNTRDKL